MASLFCAVGLVSSANITWAAKSQKEGVAPLEWPTKPNSRSLQIFRTHGLKSGPVVRTERTFEKWGKGSSVTWNFANNIAGQYRATLTYRSSQDVNYSLQAGDQSFEGVIGKGEGVLKHPVSSIQLERIGVYPIKLSITSGNPENDFELTDVRLRFDPGAVVMSKPVLIAGGDWLKVQGSLELQSDAIEASDIKIHATIKPWPTGDVLWEGPLSTKQVAAGIELDHTLSGLQAKRWSPDAPHLYEVALEVRAGNTAEPIARSLSRMGFRDFETKDGRFYLNGQPIFLRGNSIIPPGWGHVRGLNPDVANHPDSIREYILKLKEFNVNLIRVHDPVWLSLCDELGMMTFTGRYGVPKWGGAKRYAPPVFDEGAVRYYKQHFAEDYMNHPSVVIWVLTNEMPSAMSSKGQEYITFLKQVYAGLSEWDPTRAYIENAGFGLGQAGDVNDFHVYVGWYNGIVQSLYKFREDLRALTDMDSPVQPMAFTEMIGAYTDTLGRMPGTGKQVSAGLMWGGNESDVPEHALGYQRYLTEQFLEITRRLRSFNPTIAGLMPFTTTALGWEDAQSVDEIQFKPHIAEGFTTSYQPILLSFENWRPHVYAGDHMKISVHLINDADDGRDLSEPIMQWRLVKEGSDKAVQTGSLPFAKTVEHYSVVTQELLLEVGAKLKSGQYVLEGEVVENGQIVSTNDTPIWVEQRDFPALDSYRKITLYDPLNETRPILEKAGMVEGRDFHMTTSPFAGMRQFDKLSGSQLQETLGVEDVSGDTLVSPSRSVMIIGSKLWLEPLRDKYLLMGEFIRRGGRVVLLHPNAYALNDIGLLDEIMVTDNEWIGDRVSVDLESLWHTSRFFGAWINPRRSDTRIFEGIDREQLWLWSDTSDWNPNKPGLPEFEPVDTFLKLRDAEALETTAILANFGRGLEHVALAEVFRGEGSVILSGFDFDRFTGFDPIADKVLRGIVSYAGDEQKHAIVPQAKMTTNLGSPSDEDGIIPSEFRNGLLLEYHKDFEGHDYFKDNDYQVRRIAGPFWFNRLCHTKLINPENKVRHGFLHVRPPEGVSEVVFQIRRVPTRETKGRYEPESVKVSIGEKSVEAIVAGEDEVEVRIPLPKNSGEPIKIDFEGTSDMGISTMSFE